MAARGPGERPGPCHLPALAAWRPEVSREALRAVLIALVPSLALWAILGLIVWLLLGAPS